MNLNLLVTVLPLRKPSNKPEELALTIISELSKTSVPSILTLINASLEFKFLNLILYSVLMVI